MPLATGVQILTCIGWLDMLAHGFEFGGVGGAVGGLCCVIQHHLLLTCPYHWVGGTIITIGRVYLHKVSLRTLHLVSGVLLRFCVHFGVLCILESSC